MENCAMVRLCSLFLFGFALPQPSSSQQIFETFDIELPSDLHFIDCEDCANWNLRLNWTPEIDPEALATYNKYLETGDYDDYFGDQLAKGVAGTIELFFQPYEERHRALNPQEAHALYCWSFRQRWGFGFSDFDQEQNIGHCATSFGAMVYTVCRYFDEGVVCGSGADYIALTNTLENDQHEAFQRWSDSWNDYEKLPTPDAEKGILASLRSAGNVPKIEEVLINISQRNDD